MFVENLAAFFADFGVAATLDGQPLRVIFDKAQVEALGMGALHPVATAPTADTQAATNGTPMVIGGVSYVVRANQPDGTGISTLILETV